MFVGKPREGFEQWRDMIWLTFSRLYREGGSQGWEAIVMLHVGGADDSGQEEDEVVRSEQHI